MVEVNSDKPLNEAEIRLLSAIPASYSGCAIHIGDLSGNISEESPVVEAKLRDLGPYIVFDGTVSFRTEIGDRAVRKRPPLDTADVSRFAKEIIEAALEVLDAGNRFCFAPTSEAEAAAISESGWTLADQMLFTRVMAQAVRNLPNLIACDMSAEDAHHALMTECEWVWSEWSTRLPYPAHLWNKSRSAGEQFARFWNLIQDVVDVGERYVHCGVPKGSPLTRA